MSTDSHPTHWNDDQDEQIGSYRPVSASAVAGLILGLLSPLALLGPLLWFLPPSGIVVSAAALWRIGRVEPAPVGRKAALLGLFLAMLFAAAAPVDKLTYRWLLGREARRFSDAWFHALLEDSPQKAHQLTIAPDYRQRLDDQLVDFYRHDFRWHDKLDEYVDEEVVRALLALGPNTRAQFYDIRGVAREFGIPVVFIRYAVTFVEAGKKKTFFVGLKLERQQLVNGTGNWRVVDAINEIRPPGV